MLYLSATREKDGKLRIVATNIKSKNILDIYRIRQNIETLFGCLKIKGFRFEDTHMVDPDKISKLLVLISIGFCWAIKTGEWRELCVAKIKIKSHGRKEQSIFRYGFDFIRESILKLHIATDNIITCIMLINIANQEKIKEKL